MQYRAKGRSKTPPSDLYMYMRSPEYAIQPALPRAYVPWEPEKKYAAPNSHIDTCVVLVRNLRQTEGRHVASVNAWRSVLATTCTFL